jgi:hypothetical protein
VIAELTLDQFFLMLFKKGLLRRVGHRTDVVSGAQATAYGIEPGPSLVKRIREHREQERQRAQRLASRDERRQRRLARRRKDGT